MRASAGSFSKPLKEEFLAEIKFLLRMSSWGKFSSNIAELALKKKKPEVLKVKGL